MIACAAILALLALPLPASADAAPATISGSIASVDGARLPHASIALTDETTGRIFRATSDELGAFAMRVPPGTYSIRAEFPGLAARVVPDVDVREEGRHLDIALEPLQVHEVLTVSAALPRDSVEITAVRESPARDVGELLAESPGLAKVRKGAIANDVVLRGLQSRDLAVLIDGERLHGACPNVMDPPTFHVDFSQVERVDIGKGPFDVRHPGSFGGIVNVVTRQPGRGWNATASLTAGSFSFMNPSATVSYGGERASLLGGVSYRSSAPFRDGRGDLMTVDAGYRADASGSDAFDATTAWGRAAFVPAGDHRIEAAYTSQRTDRTLYPYLLMDAVRDDADRLSLRYERGGAGPARLTAQGWWNRVDHVMTDALRTSSSTAPRGWSMGTDATTETTGVRAEADLRGGTIIGAELLRWNWNAETMMAGMGAYAPQYSIPDVDVDSAGVFAERAIAVGSRAALDLGARIDRVETGANPAKANLALYTAYHRTASTRRSDVLASGRAKLSIELSEHVDASIAIGQTARAPQPTERYFGLRRKGTDWVGDPDLDPATNRGLDLSISVHRPRLTVTANAWANDLEDFIAVYAALRDTSVPAAGNPAARSWANVDARQWGVEASGSLSLPAAFSMAGDVAYLRGTMTPRPELGITSANLAETPPFRSRLRLRVDDGRRFGEIEGVATTAQRRVDGALGESPTPSYQTANVTAGMRTGRLTFTLGVANLFDAWYVEHLSYQRDPFRSATRVPEPGRNVFTTVGWAF
ncbi:MAG TPA: TonB-dependent receptor [Thermoanaerobaculia bacterium]